MCCYKFVIVLCVLGTVSGYHYQNNNNYNDDLRVIDSIRNEPQCISKGGLCVIADDCPAGRLAEEPGLCPVQQRSGVECCYGLSEKETRCAKRGGHCTSECNDNLKQTLATDCPKDTVCCTLVK